MNPSLPGGATDATTDAAQRAWWLRARLGFTFIPFDRLQQGSATAPNPSQLAIDLHLGTLQATAAAPTATSFDAQLPFGRLVTRTIAGMRTDRSIGDLELRLRQGLEPWLPRPRLRVGLAAGVVLPTAPYVARSGAANLPPEAAHLTLGRGVSWWLVEADARVAVPHDVAAFAQTSARGPGHRADDGYAWGTEARLTAGATWSPGTRLTWQLAADAQWRDGATEPDPFGGERLTSANAGGWQLTATPSVSLTLPSGLAIAAGVRIPLHADVTGNQLVPATGGFAALSFLHRMRPPPRRAGPRAGTITVVDYWATWCAPCAEIDARLRAAEARWPDVRVERLDASAWPDSDAPRLPEGVGGLPVVEVFDAQGRRHALLTGTDALRVVEVVDALRASAGVGK